MKIFVFQYLMVHLPKRLSRRCSRIINEHFRERLSQRDQPSFGGVAATPAVRLTRCNNRLVRILSVSRWAK